MVKKIMHIDTLRDTRVIEWQDQENKYDVIQPQKISTQALKFIFAIIEFILGFNVNIIF